MALKTIAGPFKTAQEAAQTALDLGNQYSWYGEYLNDEEGYTTKEKLYYVDVNANWQTDKIFGRDIKEFLQLQYK